MKRRPLKGFKIPPTSDTRPPTVPGNLDKKISVEWKDEEIVIEPDNIEVVKQLGRGAYGIVEHVRHPAGLEMAVKRIPAVSQEQKTLLMDMDVLDKGMPCPEIVKYYGALFWEGDLWIFMEIMDASLDKFYKLFYEKRNNEVMPEEFLGKVAARVVKALHYLHSIKIIHRDVKPSNILINRKGEIKLCDFGIAGHLVNSIAKTHDAGCKPYMAPERIKPSKEGYNVRSDVWSLGISLVEMAIGKFPYKTGSNIFEQIKAIFEEKPPRLPENMFSCNFEDFIVQCLQKDFEKRPNYTTLLEHPFITSNSNREISEFVTSILNS